MRMRPPPSCLPQTFSALNGAGRWRKRHAVEALVVRVDETPSGRARARQWTRRRPDRDAAPDPSRSRSFGATSGPEQRVGRQLLLLCSS